MFSFLSPIIYVQISPDRLTVRNVESQVSISEVPEVAIKRSQKTQVVAAYGSDARKLKGRSDIQIVNPFAHPRSLVSDFTVAQELMKAFVRKLLGQSFFRPTPRIVLHPLGDPAGGFTQVENRAFREMGYGAGASRVVLWTGRVLKDQEVLDGTFGAELFIPAGDADRQGEA